MHTGPAAAHPRTGPPVRPDLGPDDPEIKSGLTVSRAWKLLRMKGWQQRSPPENLSASCRNTLARSALTPVALGAAPPPPPDGLHCRRLAASASCRTN